MRRAVLRLGVELQRQGVITRTDDVFFLTRSELVVRLESSADQRAGRAKGGESVNDLRPAVAARRQQWERQRRLSPPLTLGNPLGARVIVRATNSMRVPGVGANGAASVSLEQPGRDVLIGMPASPGRVTGPVRIVRGSEDFARFQVGEVLVAQVTAPAWTPLFSYAAAVVTDGGSLAAHASLVAREYGIPAVVGTGDATARLRDGQLVLVDGNRGQVTLLGSSESSNRAGHNGAQEQSES